MKKQLLTIALLLITAFTLAQNPKVQSILFKEQYTLAQRNAMSLGANDHKIIYVVDTGVNELQIWDGDSWESLSGSNQLQTATIDATTYTLQEADILGFKQHLIASGQTDVTITIPELTYNLSTDEIIYIFIYHEGTGDVTVEAATNVTFSTTVFSDKNIVLYSDTDNTWKIKETGSGGPSTDNLEDVVQRGNSTTSSITTRGLTIQQNDLILDSFTGFYALTLTNPTGHSADHTQTFADADGMHEVYVGEYNATTNTPTLSNASLNEGAYYRVTTAGTQDFGNGNITFEVGDYVGCNDTEWFKKVDNNQSAGLSVLDRTGSTILFDAYSEYNASSPLSSGNITLDNTGAIAGVETVVYVESNTEPTISGINIQARLGQTFEPNRLCLYHFRYNTNNEVILSISVDNSPKLIAPLNFTSSIDSATSLVLNWDDDPNADNYVLFRDVNSDFSTETQVYSNSISEYTDIGLTESTTYYYRVKSQGNGFLDSEFSTTSGIPEAPSFSFSLFGMTASGSDYQNTSSGNYADAYGVTTSSIADNVDGSFEYIIDTDEIDTQGGMFGLSTHGQLINWNNGTNPWNITVYISSVNSQVFVSSNGGTASSTGDVVTYSPGNLLKLVRDNTGNIKLYENTTEIHDFGTLTGDLYAHISAFQNKYVNNPRIQL